MNAMMFLVLNLALGFYNVGTIWAHEVDIFRSWTLLDAKTFRRVQERHWRKLPYWIFVPLGLAFAGAIGLVGYHPEGSPGWGIWGTLGCQLSSHALTGALWGPWQARLSQDERGPQSPYLARILSTHWIRTLLISAYAFVLLLWTLQQVSVAR